MATAKTLLPMKRAEIDKETWNNAGSATGSPYILLPENWNELCFICRYGTSSAIQNQVVSIIVPRPAAEVISSDLVYTGGAGPILAQVMLYAPDDTYYVYRGRMIAFQVNGTDYTSTSRCYLYYR